MATLSIKTAGLDNQSIELKLGTNRIGRSPDCDFTIRHPTISSLHCELVLSDSGVVLRDLESTNGTFVGGCQVRETPINAGQTVRLGDVELHVDNTDAKVAIPKFFEPDLPAPPVVSVDGAMMCPRHPRSHVTHQCTFCKEVMCEPCVHRLRRRGGKQTLLLCPICSKPVEIIGETKKPKKKSFLARVSE